MEGRRAGRRPSFGGAALGGEGTAPFFSRASLRRVSSTRCRRRRAIESPLLPRTVAGAFAFTGAFTAVAGETSTEPTCTVPIDFFTVWSPPLDSSPELDEAWALPVSWCAVLVLSEPLQSQPP